ncbi:MAG: STAS domain-containing protein [Phycisphaerales bacterium]|nr:STAS domain-containing protein [Phycisphaerales bacterium]
MNESDDIVVHTVSFDGGVILQPVGDVDLARAPGLRRVLTEAQAKRPQRIVIDLSQVPYMDSSGVATLVEAMQRARAMAHRLVLAAPQTRVRSIFEIARLDTVFTISNDAEAAKTV